jgi:hypothetical protein
MLTVRYTMVQELQRDRERALKSGALVDEACRLTERAPKSRIATPTSFWQRSMLTLSTLRRHHQPYLARLSLPGRRVA